MGFFLDDPRGLPPETYARELLLKVRPGIPIRLLNQPELFNQLGLSLRLEEFSPKFDGACFKSDHLIVINSRRPARRQNFTCAHELGHYVLPWHEDPNYVCTGAEIQAYSDKKAEREASRFAAELLMPHDEFRRALAGRRLTAKDVEALAEQFYVSQAAAAWRYVEASSEECCAMAVVEQGETRYSVRSKLFRSFVRRHPGLDSERLAQLADQGPIEVPPSTWLMDKLPEEDKLMQDVAFLMDGIYLVLLTIEIQDEERYWRLVEKYA